jgi:hypothetical protein
MLAQIGCETRPHRLYPRFAQKASRLVPLSSSAMACNNNQYGPWPVRVSGCMSWLTGSAMLRHVTSIWKTRRIKASPENASLKDIVFLRVDSIMSSPSCLWRRSCSWGRETASMFSDCCETSSGSRLLAIPVSAILGQVSVALWPMVDVVDVVGVKQSEG